MNGDALSEAASFAGRLADAAAEVTRRYFRQPIDIESKADESPVTRADREAEAAMRALIEAQHPNDGIYGEEHGVHGADRARVWVLDPIDGTKSFISGVPVFGTLVALVEDGAPVVGVIDQPISGERWVGVRGRPTTLNGAPARTRACATPADASLFATSPTMFKGADIETFARLGEEVAMVRHGIDCYAAGLLASGHVDLLVEASLEPYDYCALVPVIEGAGGVMTDWRGAALTLGSDGRVAAAGDRRCHEAVLGILAA